MLPCPTKHGAALTLRMLMALGHKYKYDWEDVLRRGHAVVCSDVEGQHEPHLSYALPWKRGDLKPHREEGWREPQGEGETGWCQALQS